MLYTIEYLGGVCLMNKIIYLKSLHWVVIFTLTVNELMSGLILTGNGNYTDRPDTADLEVQHIQRGSPAPSLAVTEGDYGDGPRTGARSTLQG